MRLNYINLLYTKQKMIFIHSASIYIMAVSEYRPSIAEKQWHGEVTGRICEIATDTCSFSDLNVTLPACHLVPAAKV